MCRYHLTLPQLLGGAVQLLPREGVLNDGESWGVVGWVWVVVVGWGVGEGRKGGTLWTAYGGSGTGLI